MRGDSSCPKVQVWQQFVLGQVADPEAAALEQHLTACDSCVETLHGLESEDALVQAMRQAPAAAALLSTGDHLKGLVKRLAVLRPPAGASPARRSRPRRAWSWARRRTWPRNRPAATSRQSAPPPTFTASVSFFTNSSPSSVLSPARHSKSLARFCTSNRLKDTSLAFFLDGKPIAAEKLEEPIPLKPGDHELLIRRGDQVIKRMLFTVSIKNKAASVEIKEVTGPPEPAPPTPAATDPDRRAAEWVLQAGGSLLLMVEGQEKRVAALNKLASGRFQVTGIELPDNPNPAIDTGLDNLQGLLTLKSLDLHGTKVTAAGLQYLKQIKTLEWLNVILANAATKTVFLRKPQLKHARWYRVARVHQSHRAFLRRTTDERHSCHPVHRPCVFVCRIEWLRLMP